METCQIQEGAAVYYLTFTVVEWLPVFIAEEPCLIVTESLNYCYVHKSLRINAFVIMPTHVHLILFDKDFDNERLRRTLRDMRQFTGRQLADFCQQRMPDAFKQVINNPQRTDRARQFWQQSRHPVAIWTESFWQTKVNYLHDNPRRKGLVLEAVAWRFSSAAYWLLVPPGGDRCKVNRDWLVIGGKRPVTQ
jgi:REP element-mobilizing transposase RayT